MKRRQNNENGQAIVLIAFALVVMIAFAALAIDGGMVYSDRRHAQNAADSGALAGGGEAALILGNAHVFSKDFHCNLTAVTDALTAAESTALEWMTYNGYPNPGTADPADATCVNITQDANGNDLFFPKKYIELKTDIITETQTSLIQVVYKGDVKNRVTATTRIEPLIPYAFGQAVVGLNPETNCSSNVAGIKFGGTGDSQITGGGVWSEGCLTGNGSCAIEVIDDDLNDDKYVGIGYAGGTHSDCPTMSPTPKHANERLPEGSYTILPPGCAGAHVQDDIKVSGNQVVNLSSISSNLICLESSGNAIKMTGGELISEGKTIYLVNGGDIEISGGEAHFSAPPDDTGPGLRGILFYVDDDSVIDITGNITSTYEGLIYAPKSEVKITGTGDIGPTFNTQIVGWNVSILGTANIKVNFDDALTAIKPATLNLQK